MLKWKLNSVEFHTSKTKSTRRIGDMSFGLKINWTMVSPPILPHTSDIWKCKNLKGYSYFSLFCFNSCPHYIYSHFPRILKREKHQIPIWRAKERPKTLKLESPHSLYSLSNCHILWEEIKSITQKETFRILGAVWFLRIIGAIPNL